MSDHSTNPDTVSLVPSPYDFSREGRDKMIQEAAYFKAEARGFSPGHELDDWLEAEKEIDEKLTPLPSY